MRLKLIQTRRKARGNKVARRVDRFLPSAIVQQRAVVGGGFHEIGGKRGRGDLEKIRQVDQAL